MDKFQRLNQGLNQTLDPKSEQDGTSGIGLAKNIGGAGTGVGAGSPNSVPRQLEKEILLDPIVKVPEHSDFPIYNLPLGVFRIPEDPYTDRIGTALGDFVVDLHFLEQRGFVNIGAANKRGGVPTARPSASLDTPLSSEIFYGQKLNAFAALGRPVWISLRQQLLDLLSNQGWADGKSGHGLSEEQRLKAQQEIKQNALIPKNRCEMQLPFEIGDYTDFYTSEDHARNVGRLFRGEDNALMPNWKHVPIGYHGRSSTLLPSGVDFHRPWGQLKSPTESAPQFRPSEKMDYELEVGLFVGQENKLGQPVTVDQAKDFMFGLVLLNDWSARDIQAWEYQPLGPFLGKSFASTLSLWVVSFEALEFFACGMDIQEPVVLKYLQSRNEAKGTGELSGPGRTNYDLVLEAYLKGETAKAEKKLNGEEELLGSLICRTNLKAMYWSFAQQIAHHTSNGCQLRVGDLLGSGTLSAKEPESWASLLERTYNGKQPLQIKGEGGKDLTRSFFKDGDEVCLKAFGKTQLKGRTVRMGFGEAKARLLPAIESVWPL